MRMKVSLFCKNYFDPLAKQDANGKDFSNRKTIVILKITSYALVFIPAVIGIIYGLASIKKIGKVNPASSTGKTDFLKPNKTNEDREQEIFNRLCEITEKEALTDEEAKEFKVWLSKLEQIHGDELVERHSIRMKAQPVWEEYQELDGEEKALQRLHEIIETLALKWKHKKDFDEPLDTYDFWPAHLQAIRVENHYMMLSAHKMGIPLTWNALSYIRLVDELNLHTGISIWQEDEVHYCVETLTKNQENAPSMEEMKNFVRYICESGALKKKIGSAKVCTMVWSRYLFTMLYKEYSEAYEKILLFLFWHNELLGNYTKYDPEKILGALRFVLQDLNDLNKESIERDFLAHAENFRRKEYLQDPLKGLIDKMNQFLLKE